MFNNRYWQLVIFYYCRIIILFIQQFIYCMLFKFLFKFLLRKIFIKKETAIDNIT